MVCPLLHLCPHQKINVLEIVTTIWPMHQLCPQQKIFVFLEIVSTIWPMLQLCLQQNIICFFLSCVHHMDNDLTLSNRRTEAVTFLQIMSTNVFQKGIHIVHPQKNYVISVFFFVCPIPSSASVAS